MHDVGLGRISDFINKHHAGKGALEAWHQEAIEASWVNSMDIKRRYASSSFLEENHVVFNIKGNSFRLVTQVAYNSGTVIIKWIGTHAEYGKKIFP